MNDRKKTGKSPVKQERNRPLKVRKVTKKGQLKRRKRMVFIGSVTSYENVDGLGVLSTDKQRRNSERKPLFNNERTTGKLRKAKV